MKYLDAAAGLLVLGLRLLSIPLRQAPTDWIAVLAIFWMARSLAPENSRTRDLFLAGLGLWLTALYAWNQGPQTWAVLTSF